jgi:uncharacterized membrane-anchored protein
MIARRIRLGVLAAFLLQAALLAWLVADRAILLRTGTEIRLAVVPVDPRDLLRGDYIVLATPLSRIRTDVLSGDDAFSIGETVFVTVERRENAWRAVAVHRTRPVGPLVLQGRISGPDGVADCTDPCRAYRVEYGLERFFVPEGKGRGLERLRNGEQLEVDVAVAGSGRAAPKRLIRNGRVLYEVDLL